MSTLQAFHTPALPVAAPVLQGSLIIEHVAKIFETSKGPVVALRDINLEIRRGEFVSLIGHSGCGKSTLLNMIAGLTEQSTGRITLDGQPITRPGPERGVVFQNYSLLPWLSVFENVFEAVDSVYTTKPRAEKRAL